MPYVSGLNKKTDNNIKMSKLKTKELVLVVQLLMLLFRAVKLVFSALVTTSTLNAKVTENKSKMPDCVHFVGTPEFDKLESKKKKTREVTLNDLNQIIFPEMLF